MIKNKEKTLTPAQERALPLLLSCHTYEQAAREAKISQKQLYEWLKQPHFVQVLKDHRKAIVEGVRHSLQLSTEKAVATLIELLEADSDSVRLRAALGILEQNSKLNDIANVEERLSILEEHTHER